MTAVAHRREDNGRWKAETRARGIHGQFIPRGTKQCIDCWAILPADDEFFFVKKRWPDGSVRWWQSYCKPCQRLRTRVHLGMKNRGKPYGERQPATDPEILAERRRKRARERMETDLEYREHVRALGRRNARERYRMKKGNEEVRLYSHYGDRQYEDWWSQEPTDTERLDSAPFVRFLRGFPSPDLAAAKLGIDARLIRGLLAGERKRVLLPTVDRALVAFGRPDLLNTLYPVET